MAGTDGSVLMIIGMGIDLVDIKRIARLLQRYGDRFARRILSRQEYSEFISEVRQPDFLARRFAVKEAAAKALGTGIAGGVRWRDIELCHNDKGAPQVRMLGAASELAIAKGIISVHISLSDSAEQAVACAIFCNDQSGNLLL